MQDKQIAELCSLEHPMKGYKATNSAGMPKYGRRTRPYEAGRTYTSRAQLSVCSGGLHFCRRMADVYSMYGPTYKTRVFEVEAIGDTRTLDAKSCTDRLRIVKELKPDDILCGLLHDFSEAAGGLAMGPRISIRRLLWSVVRQNYRHLAGDHFMQDRIQAWAQAFLDMHQELADSGVQWSSSMTSRLVHAVGKRRGE